MTEPSYLDDAARARGTRVHELYVAMRAKPKDSKARKAFAAAVRAARVGPALNAGEILDGRFRLLAHLGDGTLAGTWHAWDLEDGRDVAIKVLQARFLSDPGAVKTFDSSIESMASLSHANLCPVVAGTADYEGFRFAVLDYIEGGSLEEAISAGRINPTGALQAVIDAGRGLASAHDQDLFHGNISPRNILLTADGVGMLCDLQLSARDGHHMGSMYTAPEAAEPGFSPGIRSDLYAYAMTFLYALYGKQLPFWIIRDAKRLIDDIDIDESIRDILAATISWDADERCSSVGALLNTVLQPTEVVMALGDQARRTRRFELAREYYERLLERMDGKPDVRIQLASVLADLGESVEATEHLMVALRHDELDDVDGTLMALRELSENTGEFQHLLDAVLARAEEDALHRDALLIEAARIQQERFDDAGAAAVAWRNALDVHKTRAQAAEALGALVTSAADNAEWEAFVSNGKELIGYLPEERRSELLYRLGKAYLDELGDQQNGLLWLEKALEEGYDDPTLAPTLEGIRSTRGDWPKVLKLMRAQVESQDSDEAAATLRRAVLIARYAAEDADQVGELYEELLEVAPDDPAALRASAAHAADDGDVSGAVMALEQLVAQEYPPASDSALLAEALVVADRSADALECLKAALLREPGHLACLWMSADLMVDAGDLKGAAERYQKIARALEGFDAGPAFARALLNCAELAWLAGDGTLASTGYHRVLEVEPDNSKAWWGLAKVAIWAFSDKDQANAWLRATPTRFTPQEALARLLAGIVRKPAAKTWMALDPLGAACWKACKGRSMLEVGACIVDLFLRRELVGPELFEQLSEWAPEAGVHIEAVRWLWCEIPTDHLFPVAESYRWAAVGGKGAEFDLGIHRTVMYASPPHVSDPPPSPLPWKNELRDAWAKLFKRGKVKELAIEKAEPLATMGLTPAMAPERPRHAVLSFDRWMGERHTVRMHSDELTIGSDPEDDLPCDELEPTQCTVFRRGTGTYYVVGRNIEVDSLWVAERRLEGDETVQIGPVSFIFHLLETQEALPEPRFDVAVGDDLDLGMPEDFPEDGPTHQVEMEDGPAPNIVQAAVFFRREGSERMVPFESDTLVVGRDEDDDIFVEDGGVGFLYRLKRDLGGTFTIEDSASSSEDEIPAILPLVSGDTFTVGDVVYEFRVLDAEPASPPPPPAPKQPIPIRGIPLLVLDDDSPTGAAIPLRDKHFTIGRGRNCSLKLADDAKISRNHATIVREADGSCVIKDHNSSNGTYVNKRRIDRHILQVGDQILVGVHRFYFRLGDPADYDEVEEEELVLDDLTDPGVRSSDPIGL